MLFPAKTDSHGILILPMIEELSVSLCQFETRVIGANALNTFHVKKCSSLLRLICDLEITQNAINEHKVTEKEQYLK